jgi:putative hydrolase of the HAD superfamily
MVSAVVFDIGGVLTAPPRHVAGLARRIGAGEVDFEAGYWKHRERWDRGCPEAEYWSLVGSSAGVEVSAAQAQELTVADVSGWLDALPEPTEPLLNAVAAGPATLAVLSNMPAEMAALIRQEQWMGVVDVLVFSGEVGLTKPDRAIFTLLQDQLGIDRPEQVIFFDDREENVDGAGIIGWDARLWAGHRVAAEALVALGLIDWG